MNQALVKQENSHHEWPDHKPDDRRCIKSETAWRNIRSLLDLLLCACSASRMLLVMKWIALGEPVNKCVNLSRIQWARKQTNTILIY